MPGTESNQGKTEIVYELIKNSDFNQAYQKAQSGGLSGNQQLNGISGSPYLFDEWNDGVITMKDNTEIKGRKYRYNLYTQQMQFINGQDTAAIANPEVIRKISFGGKTFIFT